MLCSNLKTADPAVLRSAPTSLRVAGQPHVALKSRGLIFAYVATIAKAKPVADKRIAVSRRASP